MIGSGRRTCRASVGNDLIKPVSNQFGVGVGDGVGVGFGGSSGSAVGAGVGEAVAVGVAVGRAFPFGVGVDKAIGTEFALLESASVTIPGTTKNATPTHRLTRFSIQPPIFRQYRHTETAKPVPFK